MSPLHAAVASVAFGLLMFGWFALWRNPARLADDAINAAVIATVWGTGMYVLLWRRNAPLRDRRPSTLKRQAFDDQDDVG